MKSQQKTRGEESREQGTLDASSYEAEDVFENAEPWDPIETKIVVGSFAAAIVLLVVFGYLINVYLLH